MGENSAYKNGAFLRCFSIAHFKAEIHYVALFTAIYEMAVLRLRLIEIRRLRTVKSEYYGHLSYS